MDHMEFTEPTRAKFECSHEKFHVVKYQQSNSQWRIRNQCLSCGEYTSSDLKMRGVNLDDIPYFDECLRSERRAERDAAMKEAYNRYWEYRQKERESQALAFRPRDVIEAESIDDLDSDNDFWGKYTLYLGSQRWVSMRNSVLERDANLCQACLKNRAAQVHHLSYRLFKTLGKSAAFELVAICYQCHAQIHPRMAEAQHATILHSPFLPNERTKWRER